MNTSRRSFVRSLVTATCAAPLLVRSALSRQPEVLQKVHEVPTPPPMTYVVQGRAIKVPSNRISYYAGGCGLSIAYHGDWDGTFKLEPGCSNPAYILADLYERTDAKPDGVTGFSGFKIDRLGYVTEDGRYLNWEMLYDYGRWCDEPVALHELEQMPPTDNQPWGWHTYLPTEPRPRFTVNTVCQTYEDMVQLRETLRMHCLRWQGADPKWRTSWPV